jgi:ABC-type transport system involved in multi-copper enzyme maturation permease subunit
MKLLAITGLTLRELRHSKLVVLPLTVALALVLVAANIQNPEVYGNDLLLGTWTALAFVGALVGILAASSLVSSEIERGTMLLLGARPITRSSIVIGKALGILVYLALCALLWSITLAVGLGGSTDAGAWVAFAGGMVALAPMCLGAMIALTASIVFPTRGAIGATLALWLAAAIVAAIPLASVKPVNRGRVDVAQDVLGWVIPNERLGELRGALIGIDAPESAWLALVVPVLWLASAAVLLVCRGSLAR